MRFFYEISMKWQIFFNYILNYQEELGKIFIADKVLTIILIG